MKRGRSKSISPRRFYGQAQKTRRLSAPKASTSPLAFGKTVARVARSKSVPTRSPTRTMKKKKWIVKSPADGTLSHSYTTYGKPSTKKSFKYMQHLTGQQKNQDQGAGQAIGETGKQSIWAYDVKGMSGEFISLLQQSVQQNATDPLISVAVNNYSEYLLSMEGYRLDVMITNSSDFPHNVEILDLVAKKDIPSNPGYRFNPIETWERGLQQQQKGSATAPPSGYFRQYLFNDPTSSIEFNKYWKIVNRTKVEMAAGRTHRHVFNNNTGRVLTKDAMYGSVGADGGSTGYWRGISTSMLVLLNGVPVANIQNGEATTSAAELIYRASTTVKYRGLVRTPKSYKQIASLPNISIANERREATSIVEDEDTP